jgi:hypothetical protein
MDHVVGGRGGCSLLLDDVQHLEDSLLQQRTGEGSVLLELHKVETVARRVRLQRTHQIRALQITDKKGQ